MLNDEISQIVSLVKDRDFNGHEARRLLHGRGGLSPKADFINIDFFPPTILVTLFEERSQDWMKALGEQLLTLNERFHGVAIQWRGVGANRLSYELGSFENNQILIENNLKYTLHCRDLRNPGFFMDMRMARSWIEKHAKGRRLLNLFAYTCSFSVAALSAGAEHVLNMDMNKNVLSLGRENHELNQIEKRKYSLLSGSVLKSFGRIKRYGPYDGIIIDPPARQKKSFDYDRDYAKLISRCHEWVKEGTWILLSMNDPMRDWNFLPEMVADKVPQWKLIHQGTSPDDFPEKEGKGLQWLVYEKKT